jgi:alpha-mannosidase
MMKKRVVSEVVKLKDFMTTNNVLMMNGYDQEMVPDDIQPAIQSGALNTNDIKVTQENPASYLKSVMDNNPSLITLEGSLYSGRFISVFPGVMSCRMYLKIQNDRAEKAITKLAEPLSTIAWLVESIHQH